MCLQTVYEIAQIDTVQDKTFEYIRSRGLISKAANYTYHVAPMPCCTVALRCRFQSGMVRVRQGMCESNTVALCKSDGKDII
jgi:hypothetical protein